MGLKGILLLIFFCSAIISCKKDDVGDKINIDIRISENPVEGNVRLLFACEGGTFKCANTKLYYSVDRTENSIFINFGKSYLEEGQDCHTLNGYNTATARAYFTLDLPDGDYLLEFTNKDRILTSGLKIDQESIQMLVKNPIDQINLNDRNEKIWRIPDDAVWGSVEGGPADRDLIMDSLYSLGAVNYGPLLHNGSYSQFSIADGYIDDPNLSNDSWFIIKSQIDTATLYNTVRAFLKTTTLYDGKGNYKRIF